MRPTLVPGDVLLVRWGAVPRPGVLALVDLGGGRPLAVKRVVEARDGGWWVERDNPAAGVDSWLVGAIPPAGVQAVVLGRLAPLRRARRF